MNESPLFEIGELVYCPKRNLTGIITEKIYSEDDIDNYWAIGWNYRIKFVIGVRRSGNPKNKFIWIPEFLINKNE